MKKKNTTKWQEEDLWMQGLSKGLIFMSTRLLGTSSFLASLELLVALSLDMILVFQVRLERSLKMNVARCD